ncbi:MAG: hypothetical protein FJ143_15780, partial [Deltaproteobacteria bacterium]|nr:hypothetical protein [Deltaproteobacteria bacterium]
SGTILVEAATMALDIAPGLGREFAFEKLRNFDEQHWRELQRQTTARQQPKTDRIFKRPFLWPEL